MIIRMENNDQEGGQFWSSLLHSIASESEPRDDLYPEISTPMMLMSTTMTVDVMPEPWKVLGDGDKVGGNININEGGDKSTEKAKGKCKELEENAKEENKSLGKRPRTNESRNIVEKRRRTEIKNKIDKLKELTHTTEKYLPSTLESIVDRIREMKFYVENHSMGPMLPLGMGMDFPAPWFIPPNYNMPFNNITQGETSSHIHDQQIVTVTTKALTNQPYSSKSM